MTAESTSATAPPPPPKKKRGPKLTTLKTGKDYLARIIRRLDCGDLEVKRGNALVYAVSAWMEATVLVEAEGKLDAIEEAINKAAAAVTIQ